MNNYYCENNNILKVNHDEGFFSCCTIRLRCILDVINYFNKMPFVDSSNQFNLYKDNSDDTSEKFFKKEKIDDINFKRKINLINDNKTCEDQYSNYHKIDFSEINPIINEYFTLSNEVLNIEINLIENYKIKLDNTISILYRGNNKSNETILPTYQEILNKVNEVKNKYKNHVLLIQSDEIDFIDYIKSYYPESIIIEEIKKIKKSPLAIQYTINSGNKLSQSQLFLAIMKIISKTSKIILNSGNVGLWCCLFRGNSIGVYQYVNHIRKSYTIYKYLNNINYDTTEIPHKIGVNSPIWYE